MQKVYCVADLVARQNGRVFTACNDQMMKRYIYTQFKDFIFNKDLEVQTIGLFDETEVYLTPLYDENTWYKGVPAADSSFEFKKFNVAEIVAEVSKDLSSGSMEPEDIGVVENA